MIWAEQYAGRMPDAESPQLMLGRIIRAQRELAELPMRQLAATVGISNPHLSQIERGLRASGCSEEPITGVERSAALDCEAAPECPPGPASSNGRASAAAAFASATSWR